jgi:hypothetical protein
MANPGNRFFFATNLAGPCLGWDSCFARGCPLPALARSSNKVRFGATAGAAVRNYESPIFHRAWVNRAPLSASVHRAGLGSAAGRPLGAIRDGAGLATESSRSAAAVSGFAICSAEPQLCSIRGSPFPLWVPAANWSATPVRAATAVCSTRAIRAATAICPSARAPVPCFRPAGRRPGRPPAVRSAGSTSTAAGLCCRAAAAAGRSDCTLS